MYALLKCNYLYTLNFFVYSIFKLIKSNVVIFDENNVFL